MNLHPRQLGGIKVLLGLLLVVFPMCVVAAAEDEPASATPTLRVLLGRAFSQPELTCDQACEIIPRGGKQAGRILGRLGPVRASLTPKGFRLGGERFECASLDLKPSGENIIRINGKAHRGTLRLIRLKDRLAIVNIMDIETYLMGVLPSEMPLSWPDEALKAQAVAARTYALYYRGAHVKQQWDVVATVEDQVFNGGPIAERTRAIIRATRGQVLLHKDKLFPAFFHSTCGGNTESPGVALNQSEFNFLEGTSCTFCETSRHYRWKVVLPEDKIAKQLAASGIIVGHPILRIRALSNVPDQGRSVLVEWKDGRTQIPIVDFRRAVGRMHVKSGKFACAPITGAYVFTGRGLGHGTGMCQYGARGLAKLGRTYEEILTYYYKNSRLERRYK